LKDTEKESDGGYDGEDDAETADSTGAELRAGCERQCNLHPRVHRADAECQRRTNEMHQKHGVNLPTNQNTRLQ